MSSWMDVFAADDNVLLMQGVDDVRDRQRGVFVNIVKANSTRLCQGILLLETSLKVVMHTYLTRASIQI